MMLMSKNGLALLREFEGFRAQAYIPVPGDVPTIGYGFTRNVKMGDKMTRAEAAARLIRELRPYESAVERACTVPPNQNQFDAMVLLAYNIGTAGFGRSSVLKAHNRRDFAAAARAFALWNQSGGKVYPGLSRRRAKEAALYLDPVRSEIDPEAEAVEPRPLLGKVDAERPMHASEINRAGVVAGGTAAVATVAETMRAVSDVKSSSDALGPEWLLPLLLAVVVGLCGYIVWQRVQQRKGGWA